MTTNTDIQTANRGTAFDAMRAKVNKASEAVQAVNKRDNAAYGGQYPYDCANRSEATQLIEFALISHIHNPCRDADFRNSVQSHASRHFLARVVELLNCTQSEAVDFIVDYADALLSLWRAEAKVKRLAKGHPTLVLNDQVA